MASFQDRASRVEAALDDAEADLRRAFGRAARLARENVPQAEAERLIASGRQEEIASRYLRAMEVLLAAYQATLLRAADGTAAEVARQLGRPFHVDLGRDRVPRLLRDERARISASMDQAQRAATRDAILGARRAGADLAGEARAARASLGLSPVAVAALLRYEQVLARHAPAPQVDDGSPPGPADVRPPEPLLSIADRQAAAEGYRRTLATSLAAGLALALAQSASNLGSSAALDQAAEDGVLDLGSMEETWVTRRDGKVRDSHRPMHGQTRRQGQPFTSGVGVSLRFPHDPEAPPSETAGCRCSVVARALAPDAASV